MTEAYGDPSAHLANTTHLPPFETLPEWDWLVGENISATPGASEADLEVEKKRTKLSVDCLDEARGGDMRKFARLSEVNRNHLHQEVAELTRDPEVYDATRYLMLTHDILKNNDIHEAMGLGPEVDHDDAYSRLLNNPQHAAIRRYYLPSFDLLSPRSQELVLRVSSVRSNYPQTLQGEAPAATLQDMHDERDPLVRDIDITLKKFDIFGAAGHVNQELSLTATDSTYRRMRNLDRALREPGYASATERNNAFLYAEVGDFMGPGRLESPEANAQLLAVARLSCHLRVESRSDFTLLLASYVNQPAVVKEILETELSREKRATLASYSPAFVRGLADRYGNHYALAYFAHALQEAHIADRQAREEGRDGILTVQLDSLMRQLENGEFNPQVQAVRFRPHGNALIAEPLTPSLVTLDGLPQFTGGERFRGKRIVVVGEGGGSDGVQAAMIGKLLAHAYGAKVAGIVSVRGERHRVTGTGQQIGTATHEITADTEAVGDWRFLEKIPLEGDDPRPMYLLNADTQDQVKENMRALMRELDADSIIGVDTGGDSLYRNEHAHFSAHLPTDITPDRDYTVIQALAELGEELGIQTFSSIIAPGVDSPPYARDVLGEIDAARLPLDDAAVERITRTYAQWRMDGSGSEEGRYGKTPLAWLAALRGEFGFQRLDLPLANILSPTNPWRAFTVITPAMAGIVITDMSKHARVIKRAA